MRPTPREYVNRRDVVSLLDDIINEALRIKEDVLLCDRQEYEELVLINDRLKRL
jgi:hypothetical protein